MREELWSSSRRSSAGTLWRRKPVGRFENPKEEVVRFSTNPALVLSAERNYSLNWKERQQPQLSVNGLDWTARRAATAYIRAPFEMIEQSRSVLFCQ